MKNREIILRVLFFILGGVTLSIGVAFSLKANWVGASAYDLLAKTVKDILEFDSITFSYYILGVISLSIGLLLTRNKLYFLSVIPFVTLSPVVDIVLKNSESITADNWMMQIVFFIIGVYLIALGVAFLITVKSPINPIDVVALGVQKRLNFKSFGPAKIILDGILIVIVFALSMIFFGNIGVGVGTFLYCIVLGPIIDFNIKTVKKPLTKLVFGK